MEFMLFGHREQPKKQKYKVSEKNSKPGDLINAAKFYKKEKAEKKEESKKHEKTESKTERKVEKKLGEHKKVSLKVKALM